MQEVDAATGRVLLTLSESHTIMRYLADTRGCPNHWYPKMAQPRERALVDEYLDQHHNFLRQGVTGLLLKQVKTFQVLRDGRTYSEPEINFHRVILQRSMSLLESRLETKPYLCGNEISIADLSAASELDGARWLPDFDLTEYPKIKEWSERVIDANP